MSSRIANNYVQQIALFVVNGTSQFKLANLKDPRFRNVYFNRATSIWIWFYCWKKQWRVAVYRTQGKQAFRFNRCCAGVDKNGNKKLFANWMSTFLQKAISMPTISPYMSTEWHKENQYLSEMIWTHCSKAWTIGNKTNISLGVHLTWSQSTTEK
jgi:hypothetical protein